MPKNKGSSWERELSREISRWFTGTDELVVWRSAGSGSVSTNAKKRGRVANETGDLRPLGNCPYPQFFDLIHVDAKSMKHVDLWIGESNHKSNVLLKEWIKTISDAGEDKHPLMVVHWRTKKTKFVLMSHYLYIEVAEKLEGLHQLEYNGPEHHFYLVPWKGFLAKLRPQDLLGEGS